MILHNISTRTITLRDSLSNTYTIPALGDATLSDVLWTDNEFRRWLRMRIRDIIPSPVTADLLYSVPSVAVPNIIRPTVNTVTGLTIRSVAGQANSIPTLLGQNSALSTTWSFSPSGYLHTADGVRTKAVNAVPTDGAFTTTPTDGTIAVDTLNSALYFRSGGVWRIASGGGGGGGGGAPADATYVTITGEGGLTNEFQFNTLIGRGLLSARPSAQYAGRLYFVTDAGASRLTRDNGTTWDDLSTDFIAGGTLYYGNSDTSLFRSAANTLKTNGTLIYGLDLQSVRSSTGTSFLAKLAADANNRFQLDSSGKQEWGSGSAAVDTNLYRSAANVLKTDDSLIVGIDLTVTGTTNIGADTNLYRSAANKLKTDDQFAAADGVTTKTVAGTPSDGSFAATPPDGTLAVNTIANALYFRSGGTWNVPGVPPGTVLQFAGSAAPSGFVLCDGASYDGTTATYSSLWSVIGVTYGGSGQSAFLVPNLKGRVPVGRDATQTEFDNLGDTGGAKTHTLTTAEMPSHTHSTNAAVVGGAFGYQGGADYRNEAGYGGSVGATGGGGAHNNLQPFLTMNYIIKL